jgi:integrase
MRPAEICLIRPMDIDMSDENAMWRYRPASHKTKHHGKDRVIMIGARAMEVLRPHLARGADMHCFRPSDSEEKRRAQRHRERKTPMSCGNVPGSNRKRRPKRTPGDRYDVAAYRRAIQWTCGKAGVPVWSPNQLCHAMATNVRKKFGLEAAQVVLGHSKADVTQVYAERN